MLQNKNKYARDNLSNTLIIIDEAHKLFDGSLSRLESPDLDVLCEAIKHKTCKLMLMTATPYIQDPMQLIKILNLITEEKMPENIEDFAKEYLEDGKVFSYTGANKFVRNVYKNISYLDMSKDNTKFAIQIKNDVV
jgi:Rad3-related DNA helicase